MFLCPVCAEVNIVLRREFVHRHIVLGETIAVIAALYAHICCKRTIQRIIREYYAYGRVTVRSTFSETRTTSFKEFHWPVLVNILDEDPRYYLDEIRDLLRRRTGCIYSSSVIERKMLEKGITWKLLTRRASERDAQERFAFREMIGSFDPRCFLFVDESHFDDREVRRRRGRGFQNVPVEVAVKLGHGESYSLLGAMNIHGFVEQSCELVANRGVDGERYIEWIEDCIVPILNPYDPNDPKKNSILILDNAAIHHNDRVAQLVESTGALMYYLPPYSPDFNPIEASFHVLKTWLRRNESVAVAYPFFACLTGLSQLTEKKARGNFRNCGYFAPEPNINVEEETFSQIATFILLDML